MYPRIRQHWSLALAACLLATAVAQGQDKIKITKLDDLPQHTYPLEGTVVDLMGSPERINDLATQVRKDLEGDFEKYDIQDATTRQRRHSTLLAIDLIQRDYAAALKRVEIIRELESKEAAKLMTGLSTQAMAIAAKKTGGAPGDEKFNKIYQEEFAKRIKHLPWNVVQDAIELAKGRLMIFSENLLMGVLEARIEPVVAQTGELNDQTVSTVLSLYVAITQRLPLKDETIAVYEDYIAANKTEKPDIWAERYVTLTPADAGKPVLVAAWDSGTDPEIFTRQLWTNSKEQANGKDDDGNGYVDDIHGIAYDIHAQRTTGPLYPLGDAADRMPQVMKYMKGFMDIQANVDSQDANEVRKHLSSLATEDVKGFIEDLGLAGNYAHGTHVAGLMVDGNPFAKLFIARHSYDYHSVPIARTADWGERDGQKCRDIVDYLKQAGVRVVNMSWGEAQRDAESSLEANGIGDSAEERREIARKVFKSQKEGLYEALKGAPQILFVCAAGNADNDVEFDEDIPSSFDLPNLLVVGAVDQAGEPTGFTSFGKTVQVYANGFEVDSYVPGGQRMKMSGTSMASPNVANLAGKLLALDPTLTPQQVIKLIKQGADERTYGDKKFLLMNPKKSIGVLQTRLAKNGG